jgi:hypothetical protein
MAGKSFCWPIFSPLQRRSLRSAAQWRPSTGDVAGVDKEVADVTVRQLERQRDDFLADLLLLLAKHHRA